MGLDMTLEKRIYIGAKYEHLNVQSKIEITTGKDNTPIKINFRKVSSITEEVMYWQKANHIHKWFVDNCQDGEDDCRDAYVSTENIQELLDVCKKIQADHSLAEELLPCASGFFFGGTEYDEWYFQSIEDTIPVLEECLKDNDGDFYYSSSW